MPSDAFMKHIKKLNPNWTESRIRGLEKEICTQFQNRMDGGEKRNDDGLVLGDIEDYAEYAASLTVGSLLAANPLTLTVAVLLLARSWHVGQKTTTTSKLMNRFGWGGAKAGAFIGAASLASGAWVGVAAGLAAAVVVSHLQKRVGDKDDGHDREHMQALRFIAVVKGSIPVMPTISSPSNHLFSKCDHDGHATESSFVTLVPH